MAEQLTLNTHHDPAGGPVVVAVGDIDMSNAGELRDAVVDAVGDGDSVTVDLRLVTYLDSAGLAVLFAQALTTRMEVLAGGHVGNLLQISGLDTIANVRP